MKKYILAIDQGTTGTTVLVLDKKLKILAKCNQEFPQHYPKLGWVEHDLEEIWISTLSTVRDALHASQIDPKEIAAIGITNQRETTGVWNRQTLKPFHRAIVWQCRRTSEECEKLKKRKGFAEKIQKKTGLVLDPYFSATKLKWLFEHVKDLRKKAEQGEVAFGTIDTYLVAKLTQGQSHVTDVSNASRTMLMDLKTCEWDAELLKIFEVPKNVLPKIVSNSEIYGETQGVTGLPDGIPIAGMAGDQQAALFGQACFEVGTAKCTYGTGSFILMNTGENIVHSQNKMLTTVAWKLGKKTTYALEGSAFIAGAAVQWLRDGLKIIQSASEVEELASQVPDSGGIVFVPALVGLGAPHWRSEARGVITGMTRATTHQHLARATLEAIALSQYDILEAMQKDSGKKLRSLKVDGGASQNNLLMQLQSDLLRTPLVRPKATETTALGAAFLAGLGVGFWKGLKDIEKSWVKDVQFRPKMEPAEVKELVTRWQVAIQKA